VNLETLSAELRSIETEVSRVLVGQEALVEHVLVGLVARGHVLIEGVPGLGKTLLVRALSRVLGLSFRRIQFTPDLMPSDITGSTLYSQKLGEFSFVPGPVFTELLLADEVNRAPAKTQSALLEAMQERSVTTDGISRPLPDPFLVLATQNPIESQGTYPLPEAQLDRFLFKLIVPSPTVQELSVIVDRTTGAETPEAASSAKRSAWMVTSPLVELTARVGGAVRVRTPRQDELAAKLRADGLEPTETAEPTDELSVFNNIGAL